LLPSLSTFIYVNNHFMEIEQILKPLIYPTCKKDESPLGYLIRLAYLNTYSNFSWIVGDGKGQKRTALKKVYRDLKHTKWCGLVSKEGDMQFDVSNAHQADLAGHLRYCPLCIEEDGHWRASWHLQASVACIKHNVWLVDVCHSCNEHIPLRTARFDLCRCEAKFTENWKLKSCPQEVLNMQAFLEGHMMKSDNSLLMSNDHRLPLGIRSQLLRMLSRFIPRFRPLRTGANTELIHMDTAMPLMNDVAFALFSGEAGFWSFLKTIHKHGHGDTKMEADRFTYFYRNFYKLCVQSCFNPYKRLLEEYLNEYWELPLCRRNNLFNEATLMKHPWVSLKRASRDYGIDKSVLRRAIIDKQIRYKVLSKEKRNYTVLYKPDVELRIFRFEDSISGIEAANMLGVTKAQFKQLRDTNHFNKSISPREGYCGHWQFSRQEMDRRLDRILSITPIVEDEYLSTPEIMRAYGGQIDNLFVLLFDAVEEGQLPAKRKLREQGFRSIVVEKKALAVWIKSHELKKIEYSIPAVAKQLQINQEFSYQLVHTELLECKAGATEGTSVVSKMQLDKFRETYVVLSKLSKLVELSSRALMNYLAKYEIFPVDNDWNDKLKQKVYKTSDIDGVPMFSNGILEKLLSEIC